MGFEEIEETDELREEVFQFPLWDSIACTISTSGGFSLSIPFMGFLFSFSA